MNLFGVAGLKSITRGVEEIFNVTRDRIRTRESVFDCCDYKYQILDTFCATRNPVCYMYKYIHLICTITVQVERR